MLTNRCTAQVARLTALAGLACIAAPIALPASAQIEPNRPGINELSASNTQSQQLPSTATSGNLLVAQAGLRSIADELALSNDAFSTLNRAIRTAGLTTALAGRGPFTIFAPTDEAFRQLPQGTVQTLLRPENRAKLTQILTYHVVSGNIRSFGLRPGSVVRLNTLQGKPLTVRVTNASEIFVNGAKVILADIPSRNGTIHGINSVLMP